MQLHGGVSLQLIRQLDEIFNGQINLIQTVSWDVDAGAASAAAVAQHLREIAADGLINRVLIDSKVGSATGGTGVSFDWTAAQTTIAEASAGLKLIVAGGLRPDNVANAILRLQPMGRRRRQRRGSRARQKKPGKVIRLHPRRPQLSRVIFQGNCGCRCFCFCLFSTPKEKA